MSIQFCDRCDNKLYHSISKPNDDKHPDAGKLIMYCRVCGNIKTDVGDAVCILNTNILNKKVNLDNLVNKYTKEDPTLPHEFIKCPNDSCKSNYINPATDNNNNANTDNRVADVAIIRNDSVNMKYLYICTECDHVWQLD